MGDIGSDADAFFRRPRRRSDLVFHNRVVGLSVDLSMDCRMDLRRAHNFEQTSGKEKRSGPSHRDSDGGAYFFGVSRDRSARKFTTRRDNLLFCRRSFFARVDTLLGSQSFRTINLGTWVLRLGMLDCCGYGLAANQGKQINPEKADLDQSTRFHGINRDASGFHLQRIRLFFPSREGVIGQMASVHLVFDRQRCLLHSGCFAGLRTQEEAGVL